MSTLQTPVTSTLESAGDLPDTEADLLSASTRYWQTRLGQLIDQYPDLEGAAFAAAQYLLAKLGGFDHDPYEVYWHWFDSANTSPRTYTGWEHHGKPLQSMTLVELVMRRFNLEQQRNPDLLAQMGSFYTADAHAAHYNEHNEVRLDPRKVLQHFWDVDFANQYLSRLRGFWINQESAYRTVSKISMLCSATLQCQRGDMAVEDFLEVYAAVANDPSSPFSPEKLYGDNVSSSTTVVRALDVEGMVSHGVLRFCTAQGREILYCAMQHPSFVTVKNAEALYQWVQSHLATADSRQRFGVQFVRAEHNKQAEWATLQGHLSHIAKTPWAARKSRLNVLNKKLDGYTFNFLVDSLKADMEQDAKYLLMSNSRLEKGLWIGYLESFLKLYGGLSLIGWPVAALSIAAGLVEVGLYADKAINALDEKERTEAVRGAIIQALNLILTLPLLSDASLLSEYDEFDIDTSAQLDVDGEVLLPDEEDLDSGDDIDDSTLSSNQDEVGETDSDSGVLGSDSDQEDAAQAQAQALRNAQDLAAWRPVIIRDTGFKLHRHGPLAGLYVRQGFETYARLHSTLYRVRYVHALKQWAVVDPLNPYGLHSYIPITLHGNIWRAASRITLSATDDVETTRLWNLAPSDPAIGVQRPANTISIQVPLDDVEKIMDRYMVRIPERGHLLAMYDVEERTWRANHLGNTAYLWRTPEGEWRSGDRAQWLQGSTASPAPQTLKTITLPPLPALSNLAKAIPKVLHYLWIGHELPSQALLDNLLINDVRMKGYRTIIHADMDTPQLLRRLTWQFAGKANFEVKPLADEAFFQALRAGPSGAQYDALRSGVAKNYAAASDLLRYPLLDTYGGIYTDVDNTFVAVLDKVDLPAGPSDLLLDDAVVHSDVQYRGYNSHVLGSHPNNPVLKAVMRSMAQRYKARADFYTRPRPFLDQAKTPAQINEFWSYVRTTFDMTGPQVLDDVLRETRPDYYDLALRPDLRQSMGISSQEYELRLLARVQHYFPFANKAEIKVGSLHSWKTTRKRRTLRALV
ncbi:hypothetical protein IFT69_20750 [Pseudomonas putida]|nr:hypothetical protein [Pseudomonas putida]